MRPAASLLQLALCLSTAAPLVSAWPGWLPDVDSLVVRADSEGNTAQPTSSTPEASSSTSDAPSSTGSSGKTTKNSNTAKATGSSTGSTTKGKGSKPTHTTYAPDAPAGGVVMQTPATTVIGTALYKIGDFVTLGWNYTNLQGTPTAVDVLVSCSTASQTWTLTSNMTFSTKGAYVWDTEKQASSVETPLLTAMYTLIIKDSDSQISDSPEPGYLGAFSGFKFGLYAKLPYTPYPDWKCTACNSALSKLDSQALSFALTMCVVTVVTFTWFVSGLGLN